MKLIIAGSREGFTYEDVLNAFDNLIDSPITEIVSGGARGVDRFGEQLAKTKGIPLVVKPADWNKHGKSAGYIRNKEMAEYADALLALWDGESKGTKHMIDLALKNNLEVHIKRKDQTK